VRSYFSSLDSLNPLNSAVRAPQKLPLAGTVPVLLAGEAAPRPAGLHCATCDLAFTSFVQVGRVRVQDLEVLLQVEQHLAGRNHKRLATGQPDSKAKVFNKAVGRWENSAAEGAEPADSASPPAASPGDQLYCQLCKVPAEGSFY
jgi:hypothetical protein